MATAAAVLLHGAWLAIALRPIGPAGHPTAVRVVAPQVAYLGPAAGDGAAASDVRRILSPVLFSLPTKAGFSAPLRSDAGGLGPPRLLEEEAPRIRWPDGDFTASPFGATTRSLVQLIDAPRPQPVPSPVDDMEASLPAGPAGTNMFMIYWLDLPDRPPEAIPAVGAEAWAGTTSWTMTLFVCFDDQGQIRQVLIEEPSPYTDVTAAVLRIARGASFGAPLIDACGRLVVVYTPAGKG